MNLLVTLRHQSLIFGTRPHITFKVMDHKVLSPSDALKTNKKELQL